jgi:tetratricopeptide (TPR) repeat protein
MRFAAPTLRSVAAALLFLGGAASVLAESTDELIDRAYMLDRKLKASASLELYLQAEKLAPKNPRIAIGIARQYRHLMTDADTRSEKLRLAGLALAYSLRAAALAPNSAEAQLSPAISYGKMVQFQSTKEQVETSRKIKAAADKALKLDPNYDLAWHILGRWHQGYAELTGVRRTMGELLYGKLPPSTHADAARCFEKAVEANPHRLMHYIELGRTYAKMERTEEARRYLKKGLSMPNTDKDDLDVKQRGRETLETLP